MLFAQRFGNVGKRLVGQRNPLIEGGLIFAPVEAQQQFAVILPGRQDMVMLGQLDRPFVGGMAAVID